MTSRHNSCLVCLFPGFCYMTEIGRKSNEYYCQRKNWHTFHCLTSPWGALVLDIITHGASRHEMRWAEMRWAQLKVPQSGCNVKTASLQLQALKLVKRNICLTLVGVGCSSKHLRSWGRNKNYHLWSCILGKGNSPVCPSLSIMNF